MSFLLTSCVGAADGTDEEDLLRKSEYTWQRLQSFVWIFCFLGDVRLRGQTGVPAERRGSYPFIDFRLLNSEYPSVPECFL